MAKIPPETLTRIFSLLRQIAEGIEIAGATEWILFETYGENPRTIHEMVDLLTQAINDGLANWEACHASIQKIKKGWNLS